MSRVILFRPGPGWKALRFVTQSLALVALLVAPFLGGWQRLERNDLSAWNSPDTELPPVLRERLPRGDAAGRAHEANVLIGGGTAAQLVGVPFADPVAVAFVVASGPPTGRALLAFAIPLVLALVFGRLFCGWFCPFGTLSRITGALLYFVPFARRLAVPERRPVRYLILAGGIVAGLAGAHVALFAMLPHLLVQQSVYAMWLLGGGGAALGLLLGLLAAGLVFGPTTYCATICPTGGALALAGRARLVRLGIQEPKLCGTACRLCSQACWLQLEPSSGDAGPDCDLCARCVPACPRTNLALTVGRSVAKRSLPVVGVALAALLTPGAAAAQRQSPELVLAAERVVDGVTVAVDVVDKTGIPVAADSEQTLHGSEVSVFLGRGERPEPDERGLAQPRERYEGPLRVTVRRGDRTAELRFDAPTSPISTQGRSIYRGHVELRLRPGDVVEVGAAEGWLSRPQRFVVPHPGVDASAGQTLAFALGGFALFGGLISLGLAIRPSP